MRRTDLVITTKICGSVRAQEICAFPLFIFVEDDRQLGHPGEVISVLARAFTTAPPPPTLTGRLEQRVQHGQSVSHCKNVLKIESEAS